MTETVFISGADKGLRFSLATRFLHEGFRVFAGAYATSFDSPALRQLSGERLTLVPLDVTDVDSVRQAVRHVAERASALEVLINNAGVHIEDQDTPPEDLDLTDMHLERTMDVNAFGPLRTTQQFYPLLERGEHKLIIDISSEAGSIGGCWRSREFAYCGRETRTMVHPGRNRSPFVARQRRSPQPLGPSQPLAQRPRRCTGLPPA